MKKGRKLACYIAGSFIAAVVAVVIVPPLINELSTKQYRMRTGSVDIDFNNMGPDVVKRSNR